MTCAELPPPGRPDDQDQPEGTEASENAGLVRRPSTQSAAPGEERITPGLRDDRTRRRAACRQADEPGEDPVERTQPVIDRKVRHGPLLHGSSGPCLPARRPVGRNAPATRPYPAGNRVRAPGGPSARLPVSSSVPTLPYMPTISRTRPTTSVTITVAMLKLRTLASVWQEGQPEQADHHQAERQPLVDRRVEVAAEHRADQDDHPEQRGRAAEPRLVPWPRTLVSSWAKSSLPAVAMTRATPKTTR